MPDPVLLITGTSTGIGLSTAVQAASAGYTVVATMRDLTKTAPLLAAASDAGVTLDVRALDVTSGESITSCIDGVLADHGRLDAVVNNAGAGYLGTVELEPPDDIRKVMEVNFFGVVSTTRAAMPHLRAAGGRLITVSSVGGAVGQPFNEAYCAAKFAVEGFLESLAPVAASLGVTVSVIEPGPVATEFVNNVGVDIGELFADAGPYLPALQGYLTRVMAQFSGDAVQTSEQVAEVILAALTTESPAFRIQTSPWAAGFVGTKLADLDGSAVVGMTSQWVEPV
jgi:NAD(P)-dependent dehydrogenase (short-subunit alcohol dehydrogenase family)